MKNARPGGLTVFMAPAAGQSSWAPPLVRLIESKLS